MKTKLLIVAFGLLLASSFTAAGQDYSGHYGSVQWQSAPQEQAAQRDTVREPVADLPRMPRWALKTNLLYDLTRTINLGVEVRLSRALTLDVPMNYNGWAYTKNSKLIHAMVQPELRYWIHEPFNGHFIGFNLQGAQYNVGGLPIGPTFEEAMGYGDLRNFRYEGWLVGAGVSYGYHWMLSNRFSLEATVGIGYAYLDYDRFQCGECGTPIDHGKRHYFGPTKLGFSLVWMIK